MKEQEFKSNKWLTLLTFGFLYTVVYIGRFGLIYSLDEISLQIEMSYNIKHAISGCVFLSYALGSLINGRIVDYTLKPKRMILIGTSISIFSNICMVSAVTWKDLLWLSLVNGYFQSMIWVSGVCLVTQWWKSSERGIGGGIANFFSGLSHVTAFFLPEMIVISYFKLEWQNEIAAPLVFTTIFLLLFAVLAQNDPSKIGCEDYKEDEWMAKKELYLYMKTKGKKNPWVFFFKEKKMWCWCAIAFLSSLCRYGLLVWIPEYYSAVHFIDQMDANFANLILPLGMAFGTLILSLITSYYFKNNKGIMVVICAACSGTLITIFPMMLSLRIALIGIFGTGFFLYGINGILWIYAMDMGGRVRAGTVAGVLNCCAYIGTFLETYVFSFVLQYTGSRISTFVLMEVLCIAMAGFAILVSEKDTVVETE